MQVYILSRESPVLKEYAPLRPDGEGYLCSNPKFLKYPKNGAITYPQKTVEAQGGWFKKLEEAYVPPHIMKDILRDYDNKESD